MFNGCGDQLLQRGNVDVRKVLDVETRLAGAVLA